MSSEIIKQLQAQGGTVSLRAIEHIKQLEERIRGLEAFKASVDEALNMGDGSYRP